MFPINHSFALWDVDWRWEGALLGEREKWQGCGQIQEAESMVRGLEMKVGRER